MKCPKCQFENPEGMKFCGECGTRLERICLKCNFSNPPNFKFCGECGSDLTRPEETPAKDRAETEPHPPGSIPGEVPVTPGSMDGERKYVTALFSDMSGYTAMSEKLDPEEVKEITSRIFREISTTVNKYDGFIEKFIGDAIMALFGVPKAHEDDPIRAIRAAMEIHDLVRAISPELEERIGKPLTMHTGVNTGLVVTGELNLEKGTHGVAGDTINVAARLSSLAAADSVVVGHDTYLHAEGFFDFEALGPTRVKGKDEPIEIYKLLSVKDRPSTTPRHRGLRADMIGRDMELGELKEAAANLREGRGSIFFIRGDSGTGKTRLVEEFRSALAHEDVQWFEGQAYAHSQNTPYFPLIDLLNRVFEIEDSDPQEKVRERVENGVRLLIDKCENIIPYVGSLYSLSYPEIEGVSPEFWKSHLQDAIQAILLKTSQRGPAVICLEDLHWADASFIDLLRFILSEVSYAALFLCVYRPPFSFLSTHQLASLRMPYQEIHLQDFSPSEAQMMVESLLGTKDIPPEVRKFVRDNVGGNPFYLEEVINAFIQSGTIKRVNGAWILSKPIADADMPSTIHGIISARLDHLEKESKRILQEASVIGRTFLYDILKRCTLLESHLDKHLPSLERLDLIRARSIQPDLEYTFKSALTHDVVYNGLLKKERQEIHERIGLVMEEVFRDRLSEFYETLAFHFRRGHSTSKAVHYLVKAGEKSLKRYAVEESHQYFKEGFELLANKSQRTADEDELLIDILNKWSLVFYYRGDFKEQLRLLEAYKDLAERIGEKPVLGMFYAWLGFTLWERERLKDSYEYLCKALDLGEKIGDKKVIGYACGWLTWTCPQIDRLDEAVGFGEKAIEISELFPSDHYLYFKSLGGIAFACSLTGDRKRALEAGRAIIEYGQKHSNIRSMTLGHYANGFTYLYGGDFKAAVECAEKALQIAVDPFYSQFSRFLLGMSLALDGQFEQAEDALQEVLSYSEEYGCELLGTPASGTLGLISIARGRMTDGLRQVENALARCYKEERKFCISMYERGLGQVYLQVVAKTAPMSFSIMAKNVGFLLRNVPSAGKKAEEHLRRALEVAEEIGANVLSGAALLDLGLLHTARGKDTEARECLTNAIQILRRCEAEGYLKEAEKSLASLAANGLGERSRAAARV